MNGNIEEKLKQVTGIIFNNWYALKVALDHGQGGPPAIQNTKVENLLNNVSSMILALSQNDDLNKISDYLEDYMDDEFNIMLEDDSQFHVAEEVYNCYKLLQSGSDSEVVSRLDQLPVKCSVLTYPVSGAKSNPSQDDDSSSSSGDEMEQDDPDPGWTVVKGRRK